MTNEPEQHIAPPLKNGIRVTLLLLDEALCEIEEWANGRARQSVMVHEHNELSDQQRTGIIETVLRARTTISELKDLIGLRGETADAAGRIRALCSSVWPHLVELQGKHIKRYGRASPRTTELLTDRSAELIQALGEISDIAQGKHIKR